MISTFKDDLRVEKEISKFIDKYLYARISHDFERTWDRTRQHQGIDVITEGKDGEVIIDDKCAFHYANKNLETFTFEISYLKNGFHKKGWFLSENHKTTDYNLMWLTTYDTGIKPANIKFEDIYKVESMFLNKKKVIQYLKDEGFSVERLMELENELRETGKKRAHLFEGVELITSKHLSEHPVNVKIDKSTLKQLATGHYEVTERGLWDKKKACFLKVPSLPECKYSYVLYGDIDTVLSNKKKIKALAKQGIKIIVFTKRFNLTPAENFLQSELIQVHYTDSEVSDSNEILDGEDIGRLKEISEKFPTFNLEQFEIEHHQSGDNMIVKAGAGTGKTTVMVDRIQYLLLKEEMNPDEIVMITFTRDAAKKMKNKLKKALLVKFNATHNPKFFNLLEKLNEMRIQTISSFSKELLKEVGQHKGFGLNFRLKSYKVKKKEWLEKSFDEYAEKNDMDRERLNSCISPLKFHEFVDCMYDFLEKFEQKGFSSEEISNADFGGTEYHRLLNELMEFVIKDTNRKYEAEKEKENALSLNDLTREIDSIYQSRGENVFSALHKPVKQLFIDEFQDSDDSQIRLFAAIHRCFGAGIFAVGDTRQSIYRFRGANYTAFQELEEAMQEKDVPLVKKSLKKNYRSEADLLDEMNRYFSRWQDEKLLDNESEPLEGAKKSNEIQGEEKFELITKNSEKSMLEAKVIKSIKQNYKKKKCNGDFDSSSLAVLTRTISEAKTVNEWCRKNRVFTELQVGGEFFLSDAVREFHTLVSFLLHHDELKYSFPCLNGPYGRGGFDPATMIGKDGQIEGISKRVEYLIRHTAPHLWEAIDSLRFRPVFSVIREMISDKNVFDFVYSRRVDYLIKDSFTDNYSEEDIHKEAVAYTRKYEKNLGKLMELMHEKFSEDFIDLHRLRKWLEINIATNREEDEPSDFKLSEEVDRVFITTVHRAKGMEFPHVLIPFTERIFESSFNDILFSKTGAENIRVGWKLNRIDGGEKTNMNYQEFRQDEFQEVKLEETRLLHVAMTRAEDKLTIIKNSKNDFKTTWSKLMGLGGR